MQAVLRRNMETYQLLEKLNCTKNYPWVPTIELNTILNVHETNRCIRKYNIEYRGPREPVKITVKSEDKSGIYCLQHTGNHVTLIHDKEIDVALYTSDLAEIFRGIQSIERIIHEEERRLKERNGSY